MDYPEADFDFDTVHFTVSHKPTGTIFRFDDYPDPFKGNEVQVTLPNDVDDSGLTALCNAAGLHLKAHIDRYRS